MVSELLSKSQFPEQLYSRCEYLNVYIYIHINKFHNFVEIHFNMLL